MKWLDKIIYTGLWTQPLTMGIEFKMLSLQDSVQITGQTLIAMTALSLLPAFYIYMSNNIARSGGKKKFGLLDAFDGKPEPYYSTKKQVAMYPEVPEQLIAGSRPLGIVLGKYHDEFVDECKDRLQDYLKSQGEQVDVMYHSVRKINFQEEALLVRYKGDQIAPVVYMSGRYIDYLSGREMSEIVKDIARDVQEARKHQPDLSELTAEWAYERLYLSVINAEKNEELLNSVPYRKMEDLACVAKFRLDTESSVLVNEDLCRKLRMTSEEVLAIAERNMVKNGYQCEPLDLEIKRILKEQGVSDREIEEGMMKTQSSMMYVASTANHMEGAAVIASREAMHDFYEKIGESFYILPSSRHEVILLPDRCGLATADLAEMVKDVNRQVVDEKDVLSDHVYHFDGRQIERVDGIEKVKAFDNKVTKFHGKSR